MCGRSMTMIRFLLSLRPFISTPTLPLTSQEHSILKIIIHWSRPTRKTFLGSTTMTLQERFVIFKPSSIPMELSRDGTSKTPGDPAHRLTMAGHTLQLSTMAKAPVLKTFFTLVLPIAKGGTFTLKMRFSTLKMKTNSMIQSNSTLPSHSKVSLMRLRTLTLSLRHTYHPKSGSTSTTQMGLFVTSKPFTPTKELSLALISLILGSLVPTLKTMVGYLQQPLLMRTETFNLMKGLMEQPGSFTIMMPSLRSPHSQRIFTMWHTLPIHSKGTLIPRTSLLCSRLTPHPTSISSTMTLSVTFASYK